jgi:hypothetical protein
MVLLANGSNERIIRSEYICPTQAIAIQIKFNVNQ